MQTDRWLNHLADLARREPIPAIRIAVPRPQPMIYRLPKLAMSLSAGGSLLAACLLLALGLHMQQASDAGSNSSETNVARTTRADTTAAADTAIFSPIQVSSNTLE